MKILRLIFATAMLVFAQTSFGQNSILELARDFAISNRLSAEDQAKVISFAEIWIKQNPNVKVSEYQFVLLPKVQKLFQPFQGLTEVKKTLPATAVLVKTWGTREIPPTKNVELSSNANDVDQFLLKVDEHILNDFIKAGRRIESFELMVPFAIPGSALDLKIQADQAKVIQHIRSKYGISDSKVLQNPDPAATSLVEKINGKADQSLLAKGYSFFTFKIEKKPIEKPAETKPVTPVKAPPTKTPVVTTQSKPPVETKPVTPVKAPPAKTTVVTTQSKPPVETKPVTPVKAPPAKTTVVTTQSKPPVETKPVTPVKAPPAKTTVVTTQSKPPVETKPVTPAVTPPEKVIPRPEPTPVPTPKPTPAPTPAPTPTLPPVESKPPVTSSAPPKTTTDTNLKTVSNTGKKTTRLKQSRIGVKAHIQKMKTKKRIRKGKKGLCPKGYQQSRYQWHFNL